MKTNLDALIVGAGPVGLSMAAALSLQGLRFRIIDSAEDRVDESRAIGIQARTIEIFEMCDGLFGFFPLGSGLHRLVADNPPEHLRTEQRPVLQEWQELADGRSSVPMRLSNPG
jgi:2-polyprenyl-6-methoxyphenol hydroxylase-like FAD-dependent oxidoreductase